MVQNSFSIESVAAKLIPFDFSMISANSSLTAGINRTSIGNPNALSNGSSTTVSNPTALNTLNSATTSQQTNLDPNGYLGPIIKTGGLVFQYTPTITETIGIKYDSIDLTHSNESYYAYKSTDNRKISLSNCIWTCDTLENAQYALAVMHFFRSYSLMDFGATGTGKPPSPMWFSAYGNNAFNNTPCLLEGATLTWPHDVDKVGVPNPGTAAQQAGNLSTNPSAANSSQYTWMPIKFEVSNITLIVQHPPSFWLNQFNLTNYKNGTGLRLTRKGSANITPPVSLPTVSSTADTLTT